MARVGTGVLVSVKTRNVTTVTVKTLEISVCRGAVTHWTPEDIKLIQGRGSLETPTQMCVQLTCNSKTISNQLSDVIKFRFRSEDSVPILTI